jgi:hypothetical protein
MSFNRVEKDGVFGLLDVVHNGSDKEFGMFVPF